MSQNNFWDNRSYAQKLVDESSALKRRIEPLLKAETQLADMQTMLELADGENEVTQKDIQSELTADLAKFTGEIESLELELLLDGPHDSSNCIFSINAGAGGTEAQDWAEMLLRMYLRWSESKGFATELVEVSGGDVAGIKSATVHISGDYAFGWLRTEIGVHRRVRKSPFDSGNRRHTSFASVFVAPEIDDEIEIDLDMSKVRIDTYRASGAGGQHVNKTDSAVRLTHGPSGIVVQCQNQRSQHKNKDMAIKQLKAKLYELEEIKRKEEMQSVEAAKADIGWGSQIRSYVLDASRIKDLRTNVEVTNTGAVLDGDLDKFMEASLKMGL